MKKTFFVPFALVVLFFLTIAPASANGGVQLLEHCRSDSKVVDSFSGSGCHQVSNHGASFSLVDSGVHVLLYASSDCSGATSRVAAEAQSTDFCKNTFDDGSPLNDKVRSLRLVASCPVQKSFSYKDFCFEGGKDNPNCCVCPPGTKWSNVSAHYRQCIPK